MPIEKKEDSSSSPEVTKAALGPVSRARYKVMQRIRIAIICVSGSIALWNGAQLLFPGPRSEQRESMLERRRREIEQLLAESVARAEERGKMLDFASFTKGEIRDRINAILKDGQITHDEVSEFRVLSYHDENRKINQRLPKLNDEFAKQSPADLQDALKTNNPAVFENADFIAGEVKSRPNFYLKTWQTWFAVLNNAQLKDDDEAVTRVQAEMQNQVPNRFQLYFRTEAVVRVAAQAGIPVQQAAIPRIMAAEKKVLRTELGEGIHQIGHEHSLQNTIDTLALTQKRYRGVKTEMANAGFETGVTAAEEENMNQQLTRIRASRSEEAAIATIRALHNQWILDRKNKALKTQYETARDEFYKARGVPVPSHDDIAVDLNNRREYANRQSHSHMQFGESLVARADIIARSYYWIADNREVDPHYTRRQATDWLKEAREHLSEEDDPDERKRLEQAINVIQKLLNDENVTREEGRAAVDAIRSGQLQTVKLQTRALTNWAKQLAESFYDEQKMERGSHTIIASRAAFMDAAHEHLITLFELQIQYLVDLGGYHAFTEYEETAEDEQIAGTPARNLQKNHLQELDAKRIPEMQAACDAILKTTAVSAENVSRDSAAASIVEPIRTFMHVIDEVRTLGQAETSQVRTLTLTGISNDYDTAPVHNFKRDLGLLGLCLNDENTDAADLSVARQKFKSKHIRKQAKKYAGTTDPQAVNRILNGKNELKQIAIRTAIYRRLFGNLEGIDFQEAKFLYQLKEYGNENTTITGQMVGSRNDLLRQLLAGGGLILALWTLSSYRRSRKNNELREIIAQLQDVVKQLQTPDDELSIDQLAQRNAIDPQLLAAALARQARQVAEQIATDIDAGESGIEAKRADQSERAGLGQLELLIKQLEELGAGGISPLHEMTPADLDNASDLHIRLLALECSIENYDSTDINTLRRLLEEKLGELKKNGGGGGNSRRKNKRKKKKKK